MSDREAVRKGGGAGRADDALAQEAPEPTIGLPTDNVDALIPAKLLQGGEIVVLILKPSLWFIVLTRLGLLISIVLIAGLLIWLEHRYGVGWYELQDAATLGMALVTGVLLWQTLDWISRVYVLTDRRVLRQMGFFRPQIFQASLHQIQHTQLSFSIRERVFGLGTLSFSTAGTGVPEAYWVMVNDPLEVHRIVVQTLHRYRRPGGGVQ